MKTPQLRYIYPSHVALSKLTKQINNVCNNPEELSKFTSFRNQVINQEYRDRLDEINKERDKDDPFDRYSENITPVRSPLEDIINIFPADAQFNLFTVRGLIAQFYTIAIANSFVDDGVRDHDDFELTPWATKKGYTEFAKFLTVIAHREKLWTEEDNIRKTSSIVKLLDWYITNSHKIGNLKPFLSSKSYLKTKPVPQENQSNVKAILTFCCQYYPTKKETAQDILENIAATLPTSEWAEQKHQMNKPASLDHLLKYVQSQPDKYQHKWCINSFKGKPKPAPVDPLQEQFNKIRAEKQKVNLPENRQIVDGQYFFVQEQRSAPIVEGLEGYSADVYLTNYRKWSNQEAYRIERERDEELARITREREEALEKGMAEHDTPFFGPDDEFEEYTEEEAAEDDELMAGVELDITEESPKQEVVEEPKDTEAITEEISIAPTFSEVAEENSILPIERPKINREALLAESQSNYFLLESGMITTREMLSIPIQNTYPTPDQEYLAEHLPKVLFYDPLQLQEVLKEYMSLEQIDDYYYYVRYCKKSWPLVWMGRVVKQTQDVARFLLKHSKYQKEWLRERKAEATEKSTIAYWADHLRAELNCPCNKRSRYILGGGINMFRTEGLAIEQQIHEFERKYNFGAWTISDNEALKAIASQENIQRISDMVRYRRSLTVIDPYHLCLQSSGNIYAHFDRMEVTPLRDIIEGVMNIANILAGTRTPLMRSQRMRRVNGILHEFEVFTSHFHDEGEEAFMAYAYKRVLEMKENNGGVYPLWEAERIYDFYRNRQLESVPNPNYVPSRNELYERLKETQEAEEKAEAEALRREEKALIEENEADPNVVYEDENETGDEEENENEAELDSTELPPL